MLFEPCGDLRKDYGAYCETLRLTEREAVYSSIYTSSEVAQEKARKQRLKEEELKLRAASRVEPLPVLVAEWVVLPGEADTELLGYADRSANIEAKEMSPKSIPTRARSSSRRSNSKMGSRKGGNAKGPDTSKEENDRIALTSLPETMNLTFVSLRHPDFCINQRDITPLCRAIPHCLSLVALEFVGCGLSVESYVLLTEAVYKSQRVVTVSVDFNSVARPGFYADPTVVAPSVTVTEEGGLAHSQRSLLTSSPPPAPAAARGNTAQRRSTSVTSKKLLASSSPRVSIQASSADATVMRTVPDDPGTVYLKPSEFCGLHMVPSPLEELINEEREKKGKIDPKKVSQLQVQQEQLQRLNEAYRIKIPRGWHAMLLTGVRSLSLRGNGIDDKAVGEICSYILANPRSQLLSLNLWDNCITDVGAAYLAQVLRTSCTLRSLDVGHNRIEDAGLLNLVNMFRMVELSTSEDIASYRKKVLTRMNASEEERRAASQSAPATVPSYQDIYQAWHATHFLPVVEDKGKENSGAKRGGPNNKTKPKTEVPLTVVRSALPFDRDCIKVSSTEPVVRVPGNTVLECLNVGENRGITVAGAREACRVLGLHEPTSDEEMMALIAKDGNVSSWSATSHTPVEAESRGGCIIKRETPNPVSVIHTSTSAPLLSAVVYPPELHCAGLRLSTFIVQNCHCGQADGGAEMRQVQEEINSTLDMWARRAHASNPTTVTPCKDRPIGS